jgi:hypothetical protein
MCGLGETLLAPYCVDLAREFVLRGNHAIIITNGLITQQMKKICQLPPEIRENISMQISFHYLECERLAMTEAFFRNVQMIRDARISSWVVLNADDETAPFIKDIQALCMKNLGTLCNINESRDASQTENPRTTKFSLEKHLDIWKTFGSPSFCLQAKYWGEKRKEFCYAGDWIFNLILADGNIQQCPSGGVNHLANIYDNIDAPVNFAAIGHNCPYEHCYGAHAWLAFGVIPELEPLPSFAQIRDRACADGSNWLTAQTRHFFSGKLFETNQEYSEDKRAYIDALMAIEYGNPESVCDKEALANALERHLASCAGWHTFAIFGKDRYCGWLLEIFALTNLRVKFVVDSALLEDPVAFPLPLKTKTRRLLKYWAKCIARRGSAPVELNVFDRWPKVDAVIVAPYARFDFYKKKIENKTKAHIVSATQLAG